jgi:glycine cleavage system H protein
MIEGIKFTKEHEWVTITSAGLAITGISDFAQEQLGDIVSIELPKVGSKVKHMQPIGIIDSVKASSDVYCPLSGEIAHVSEDLYEHPEWINQSPYELGWIVKIKPSDLQELEGLMTNEMYNEYIGEIAKRNIKKQEQNELSTDQLVSKDRGD